MSAACRLHYLPVTSRLQFFHQFLTPEKSRWSESLTKKWWELGMGMGMGGDPCHLCPLPCAPTHVHTLTHTLFLSVQHNFRQTRGQFVLCCESISPFLGQCTEMRHSPPWRSPVTVCVPPVTQFTPSLMCTAPTSITPGTPAKALVAGGVWCAQEERQGAAMGTWP